MNEHHIEWTYFVPLLCFSSLGLFVQGCVTIIICRFLGKKLPIIQAMAINSIGGLFSLVFPFGNMGYKMLYLKKTMGISLKNYTSMAFLSFLAACSSASIGLQLILWLDGNRLLEATCVSVAFICCLILFQCSPKLVSLFPKSLSESKFVEPLIAEGRLLKLASITFCHCLSLMIYVGLYYFSLKSFGLDVEIKTIAILVIVQSVAMMINLVPGNFVLLETLVGGLMRMQGLVFWDGVLAALMIRFVNLLGLCIIGAVSMMILPSMKELSDQQEELNGN